MAKKGKRQDITLACTVCQERNYLTEKSVINTTERLELQKYCARCRKKTAHKEAK